MTLFAMQQIARVHVEDVAQDVENAKIDANGMLASLHKPLGRGRVERAIARLGELVGVLKSPFGHELRQKKAHVEHATNVHTLASRSNTLRTVGYALDRVQEIVQIGYMFGTCR